LKSISTSFGAAKTDENALIENHAIIPSVKTMLRDYFNDLSAALDKNILCGKLQ